MKPQIEGVVVSKLKMLPTEGGKVMHALKKTDNSYRGFGEAYFSCINQGVIRGWKRHLEMTLNLVVSVGKVRFILIDGRDNSSSVGQTDDVELSPESSYARLTVDPGIWVAFQGVGAPYSVILNIADIEHNPIEIEHKALDQFEFNW